MSVYSTVPIMRPKRSRFPLKCNFRTTCNIGEITPTCRPIECVPGDTMYLKQVTSVDLTPLVAPFKGDLYLESWAFFGSNQLLYNEDVDQGKFSDILLGASDPSKSIPLPSWDYWTDADSTGYKSIWSQFGNQTNIDITAFSDPSTEKVKVCPYPKRLYNMSFNEYFRDENLQNEVDLENDDILKINYKKDRFTSAFLTPQKGNTISLKLSGVGKVKFTEGSVAPLLQSIMELKTLEDFNGTATAGRIVKVAPQLSTTGTNPVVYHQKWSKVTDQHMENLNLALQGAATSTFNNLQSMDVTSNDGWNGNGVNFAKLGNNASDLITWLNTHNTFDFADATTFTLEDLRLLNKLQKWQERNQLCGSRYKEYLIANYGIAPNDETLQRPVLIGHIKTPIIVNSVLQHDPSTNSPQGTKVGNGIGLQTVNFGKWTSKEFGWIIIVSALRPKASYQQGVHRSLLKDTVYDYLNPIFQSLGQEEIKNNELYFTGLASDENSPWGYTDRYNSYRYLEDITTGSLRKSSLESWSVSRKFANRPTLSSQFIQVEATEYDYLFAVPSTTEDTCIISAHNYIDAIRPLSKYAMPSL